MSSISIPIGYLGNSIYYYHFLQNVILSKHGWSKATIFTDNNTIEKIIYPDNIDDGTDETNTKKTIYPDNINETKIELKLDDNYQSILCVNNIAVFRHKYIFKVNITIDIIDSDSFSHRFIEGLIVDH